MVFFNYGPQINILHLISYIKGRKLSKSRTTVRRSTDFATQHTIDQK